MNLYPTSFLFLCNKYIYTFQENVLASQIYQFKLYPPALSTFGEKWSLSLTNSMKQVILRLRIVRCCSRKLKECDLIAIFTVVYNLTLNCRIKALTLHSHSNIVRIFNRMGKNFCVVQAPKQDGVSEET